MGHYAEGRGLAQNGQGMTTGLMAARVGRVCPQRAGPQRHAVRGALNNIGENLVFLRRFSGDTEQIAQTDDKGGRVSRSVWSAWSLLPLSDVWRGSKAGASSTHSIRFARFGSVYAGLGTDPPYHRCLVQARNARAMEVCYSKLR